MDIQTRKLNFIQEFITIQNEEIINSFEKLLKSKKAKSNEKFEPMSLKQFYDEIDEAMVDSENGNVISVQDFKKIAMQWK